MCVAFLFLNEPSENARGLGSTKTRERSSCSEKAWGFGYNNTSRLQSLNFYTNAMRKVLKKILFFNDTRPFQNFLICIRRQQGVMKWPLPSSPVQPCLISKWRESECFSASWDPASRKNPPFSSPTIHYIINNNNKNWQYF